MGLLFLGQLAGEISFLIAVSASVLETFPIKVFSRRYYVKFDFK